ncbi:DNA polymerase III subunit delta [Gemella sp. GH3]|uniref:DNA polymerase III subunit delta n=1 Tax=unclassified Gemella TaxID=2624949 RepID=UPI0015CF8F6A|nr:MULTISPECIES: DNA polymerase III subunit delta [unclassified Gemella]MBF0713317.1 DNA polymerase III subunit delta [Gemella sp. GH3.1]NYS50269.1 DNA polymerase III subunit delta [Gemella sp. GH3]
MKNIYLLYGENREAILEYQDKLAKKHLNSELDSFTYIKYNMLETTIEDIIYECQSTGLFSNKKVIVADNSTFLESKLKKVKVEHNANKLIEYFDNINKDVILIFKCGESIDSRKKITKIIKELGEVKSFSEFKAKDLALYVEQYFQRKNIYISKENIMFFLDFSRLDFVGIKRELEKLELYTFDKKVVDKEDIELLVTKSTEYDVFTLTNTLFSKNYIELRNTYNNLKLKGEEPIFLLSLIAGQLRTYYKVKVLLQENYNQKDIATKLNMHPYRIQLATQYTYNYSIKKLMECLILCKECDEKLKSSYIDKYMELDLLINRLIEKLQ